MDKALMEEIHSLVHHHLQKESYPTVEVEEDKEVKTVPLQTKVDLVVQVVVAVLLLVQVPLNLVVLRQQ